MDKLTDMVFLTSYQTFLWMTITFVFLRSQQKFILSYLLCRKKRTPWLGETPPMVTSIMYQKVLSYFVLISNAPIGNQEQPLVFPATPYHIVLHVYIIRSLSCQKSVYPVSSKYPENSRFE